MKIMNKKHILIGLLAVLLVVAGVTYSQVKRESSIFGTDFNWNGEGGQGKIRGTVM